MRENRLDVITDKIKARITRITANAQRQFKGTNPYRKERIPDEERIQSYLNLTPDVEQELRMQFGDEPIEQMHLNMREMINRRLRNA